MKIPILKDDDNPKLMYFDPYSNEFVILTWNETHVDRYVWDGASANYKDIRSFQRHNPETT